jgi:uncharacterized protein YjbI with pentapeptide repeats
MIQQIKDFFKKHRWWFITICIIVYLFLLWYFPDKYISSFFSSLKEKDRFDAIKDTRILFVNIGAGILAITGIYLTWRRTKALDKKNKIDIDNNDNNLTLQQFFKASELLANNDNITARLSGIYLFEKIMNKNEEYHWQIVELLSAYIREHRNNELFEVGRCEDTGKLNIETETATHTNFYEVEEDVGYDENFEKIKKKVKYYRVPVEKDIQAILTVLGRRNLEYEKDENGKNLKKYISELHINIDNNKEIIENYKLFQIIKNLDLKNVNLYKANLTDVHFENANCMGSHFIYADCNLAYFENANCKGANFENALCVGSHFENAICAISNFKTAMCNDTHFEHAICTETHFEYARCYKAHFEYAHCMNAHFENAICKGAYFNNANCADIYFNKTRLEDAHFYKTENLTSKILCQASILHGSEGLNNELIEEIKIFKPEIFNDPNILIIHNINVNTNPKM